MRTQLPATIPVTRPADVDLVLVSMPFADDRTPSIQLGILTAVARAAGVAVRSLHASLDAAAAFGVEVYRPLVEHRGPLVGDWLFSVAAFGGRTPDPDGAAAVRFAATLPELGDRATAAKVLLQLRNGAVPALLDQLAAGPELAGATVVGFTCTFQQTVASIALARRLKAADPGLVVVFGGSCVDGEMGAELLRASEVVDAVVQGDGETGLAAVLDILGQGLPLPRVVTAGKLADLDASPAPDYREYFERAEVLGLLAGTGRAGVTLPFESSRGCWWGEKHHCTFCGLNGSTMAYRSKTPARVRSELAVQTRAYGSFRFDAVDNILDHRYLRDLLPGLAADADYELFYEVKANLSRPQLAALSRAGVRRIQPGLESLSSRLLALMDKGVRAAANVNLLRWAGHHGIRVDWNLLCGFPGESTADYAEQAELLPHLVHLQPPANASRVWLERFSPLFTHQTARHERRPHESYATIYPAGTDLDLIAYFFEREAADTLPDDAYEPLRAAVRHWQSLWDPDTTRYRPTLTYRHTAGLLQIEDARPDHPTGTYTFRGALADLYAACSDRPVTESALGRRLQGALTAADLHKALTEYAARGLVMRDGDLVLALARPPASRG